MIFIFGHRLFGKVDEVPGLGHVATRYFHVDYLPLVPTQSWLVMEQNGKQWHGVPIPLSAKSVIMGWGRAVSLISGVAGAVAAVVFAQDRSGDALVPALLAAFGIGFFVFSKTYKGITKASYARACQLAQLAGVNEREMAALAQAYGEAPMSHGFEPLPARPAAGQPSARNVDRQVPATGAGQEPLDVVPVLQSFFVTGRDVAKNQAVCITVHANDAEHATQLAGGGGDSGGTGGDGGDRLTGSGALTRRRRT